MNRKKKRTGKTNVLLLLGISFSLVCLNCGAEAATTKDNLYQPLSFSSIVNPNSLVHIEGLAYMCGNSVKGKTDTKTSTSAKNGAKDTKVKSGKKTVSDHKNSTSHRRAIIVD